MIGARTMHFGRYKGLSVAEVIKQNPSYLLWAHKNVGGFVLSPAEIQICIASTDIGSRAGKDTPTWMEDDNGPDEFGGMSYSDFGNN